MIKNYRYLGYVSYATGFLISLAGLYFICFYIYDIYLVFDNADKSVIFWHLPLLFLEMFIFFLGFAAIRLGKKLFKKIKN